MQGRTLTDELTSAALAGLSEAFGVSETDPDPVVMVVANGGVDERGMPSIGSGMTRRRRLNLNTDASTLEVPPLEIPSGFDMLECEGTYSDDYCGCMNGDSPAGLCVTTMRFQKVYRTGVAGTASDQAGEALLMFSQHSSFEEIALSTQVPTSATSVAQLDYTQTVATPILNTDPSSAQGLDVETAQALGMATGGEEFASAGNPYMWFVILLCALVLGWWTVVGIGYYLIRRRRRAQAAAAAEQSVPQGVSQASGEKVFGAGVNSDISNIFMQKDGDEDGIDEAISVPATARQAIIDPGKSFHNPMCEGLEHDGKMLSPRHRAMLANGLNAENGVDIGGLDYDETDDPAHVEETRWSGVPAI